MEQARLQAWLQPNILGGVQLGAKHQEDPHTAPKALLQGSGGAEPPCGGSRGAEPPGKFCIFRSY